jgi:hypothetical protein
MKDERGKEKDRRRIVISAGAAFNLNKSNEKDTMTCLFFLLYLFAEFM